MDLITAAMLVFTSISSFPGCKSVLRKSQYGLKLASTSTPSSFSCSKNFGNIRGALVVGCFVTVTVIEAKAEEGVNFTCTKSAVGSFGVIRLNLEMKQLSSPFVATTPSSSFLRGARSIDTNLFLKSLF